jgi:archaellum component FlaC
MTEDKPYHGILPNDDCHGKKYCDCAKEAFDRKANRDVVDGLEDHCPHGKKVNERKESEDKPDQPDFEKMAYDEIFKLKGSRPPFGHILRLQHTACKNGMERIWNDYVSSKEAALSAVKEENKRLREEIEGLKLPPIEAYETVESLKEENKQLRENYEGMSAHCNRLTEINISNMLSEEADRKQIAQLKSELSKKGEPVNSELLEALKNCVSSLEETGNDFDSFDLCRSRKYKTL